MYKVIIRKEEVIKQDIKTKEGAIKFLEGNVNILRTNYKGSC